MNLEERNFRILPSETLDSRQDVASLTSQEISSNSSFSTDIDFINLGLNQAHKTTNHTIPISDLINFESPKSFRPMCSSRVNSATKPSRLLCDSPEFSPINRATNDITGTFNLTPKHSINQTDRTLRKRSLSFSGQERTISPSRPRSGPSSFYSPQQEDFTESLNVPANTPAFSMNSAKHSSEDSQRGITNDTKNMRLNSNRNFYRRGPTIRRQDNIPFITHSDRKVSRWLNEQVPHNSLNSLQSPSPDFPLEDVYSNRNLTNFIISDFESSEGGSDCLPRSYNPRHKNIPRESNYRDYPDDVYNQGFCLPSHPRGTMLEEGSFASYDYYPNFGTTPLHHIPLHHTPYYQNMTSRRDLYPPFNYNNYHPPHHYHHPLNFPPMYRGDPTRAHDQRCQIDPTPSCNDIDDDKTSNKNKRPPQRSHANRVQQGTKRKIRKRSLKVGRLIKKMSRNQNVSNSSIVVETLAEI